MPRFETLSAAQVTALLFDLDDTLVNTRSIVERSLRTWCQKHELDVETVLEHSFGMRIEDTISIVAPHLNASVEARIIEELENDLLSFLEPISGARSITNEANKSAWAVVTSSPHQLAIKKLNLAGIPIPKVLIASESIETGKPSPDPYLAAIKQLNMQPQHCVAFEDSDSGIVSAMAAGCRVIGVGARHSAHPDLVATIIDFSNSSFIDETLIITTGD